MNQKKKKLPRVIAYVFLVFCCLFTLLPLTLITMISLRTREGLIREGTFAIPEVWEWGNYVEAWVVGNFSQYFINSVIISTLTVSGIVLFSLLAAYALSTMNFRGRRVVIILIMIGLVLPVESVIIALFQNMRTMGLIDTHWSVVFPQISISLAFGIFLLSGFIKDIPTSVLEAARIDGSNKMQSLVHIVTPLIVPALVSLIIFAFIGSWNAYFLPNVMLRSDAMRTLPLGLDFFRGKNSINIPLTAAASNLMALPVMMVYFAFHRKMIRGMTVGAVKE